MSKNLCTVLFFSIYLIFFSSICNATNADYINLANKFIILIDQKKYDASWDSLGVIIKNSIIKKENWIKTLEKWRKPLGKLENRVLHSTDLNITNFELENEYYTYRLKYKSTFEKSKEIWELIVVTNYSGRWQILTYYLSK